MKLERHPEYHTYTRARALSQRCEEAISAWRASGVPIEMPQYALVWTPEEAHKFVCSISSFFQMYNRVLWEQFAYCQPCHGGCCVLDATHVGSFDALALALLELPPPDLPDRIAISERDCIYLAVDGCVWSTMWRPIKCWTFYCALGEPIDPIVAALAEVFKTHLPDPLRRYQAVHDDWPDAFIHDPVDLAMALNVALRDVFVAPINIHYAVMDADGSESSYIIDDTRNAAVPGAAADALAFIAQAEEKINASSFAVPSGLGVTVDQFLADLELLEWILLGLPENGPKLLRAMHTRYAHVPAPQPGKPATVGYNMRVHILRLLEQWTNRLGTA